MKERPAAGLEEENFDIKGYFLSMAESHPEQDDYNPFVAQVCRYFSRLPQEEQEFIFDNLGDYLESELFEQQLVRIFQSREKVYVLDGEKHPLGIIELTNLEIAGMVEEFIRSIGEQAMSGVLTSRLAQLREEEAVKAQEAAQRLGIPVVLKN